MCFRVVVNDDPIPAGMALIPAGNFQMGNSTNLADGDNTELPVHTVYVSAFYMDRYEVTMQLWDDVRAWGVQHGYADLQAGVGKAANHPVQTITWYSTVKWCNARSQKEGLTPVYYANDLQTALYQTGSVDMTNTQVKWGANGYRLPTEAEWEKAARGGTAGHRFPWSNLETITYSQANFSSWGSYSYGPAKSSNPTYVVGSRPYTSPVGSFAPNGYGLYDMAGNACEWCWDWSDWNYYNSVPSNDPQGPSSSTYGRVLRGGSWVWRAKECRVAARGTHLTGTFPSYTIEDVGFRAVRR